MPRASPASDVLAPGSTLGKYQIVRQLAEGGMAEIYLARATGIAGFEKLVVLKRIIPRLGQNPEFVEMFLDEARLTATLNHPNVVHVYDVDRVGGNYFFTMEFVHGRDLASVLAHCAEHKRGLTQALAIHIVMEVAAGLHYAHDKKGRDGQPLGTVHRDVSPNNVMITYDGLVKIVDFGIAKAVARQSKTKTGTIKGTVLYMSPEQAQGHELDRRSDVFSLGVLLYELTTGTRPFRAKNDFAVLYKLVNEDAPAPTTRRPKYPPELERIVMKALAREKDARYATADALRQDLEQFAREHELRASDHELGELMRSLFGEPAEMEDLAAPANALQTAEAMSSVVVPMQRSRAWLGVAFVALGAAAFGGWALFRQHPEPSNSPAASAAGTPASVNVAEAHAETPASAIPSSTSAPPLAQPTAHADPVHKRPPQSAPSAPAAPKDKQKWNLDSPLPP